MSLVEHRMHVAFPSPRVARERGLNRNHDLRVWCECMSGQISEPGTFAGMSPSTTREITKTESSTDPRRLGGWDEIGVVDSRIPGSAVELFLRHVEETDR